MTLQDFFRQNPKTALAFSGGVDSAYLLWAARRYGKQVRAYYVNSAFQPDFELEDARRLTGELGAELRVLDLDVLAFIDHNITVNVIKNGEIVEKKELTLPKQIKNVIKCHNPRCITSIEQELPHIFCLADAQNEVYRCKYCEEKYMSSAKWT